MADHAIVEAGAAGNKPLGFGVVPSADQPHELVHEIAMKPGRTEGVLGDHPARRKNNEIQIGGARNLGGRGQHSVNRRIGMVEADRVDAVKVFQIVLVGNVVSVPCDHVKRRVIDGRFPKPSLKFGDKPEVAFAFFKGRHRR